MGVGNVFVWIVPEAGSYFEVPDDQLAKFKDAQVVVSQPHCAFLPHAAVLFPSYYKDGKQVPVAVVMMSVTGPSQGATDAMMPGGGGGAAGASGGGASGGSAGSTNSPTSSTPSAPMTADSGQSSTGGVLASRVARPALGPPAAALVRSLRDDRPP